jgi:hypothetical protein
MKNKDSRLVRITGRFILLPREPPTVPSSYDQSLIIPCWRVSDGRSPPDRIDRTSKERRSRSSATARSIVESSSHRGRGLVDPWRLRLSLVRTPHTCRAWPAPATWRPRDSRCCNGRSRRVQTLPQSPWPTARPDGEKSGAGRPARSNTPPPHAKGARRPCPALREPPDTCG